MTAWDWKALPRVVWPALMWCPIMVHHSSTLDHNIPFANAIGTACLRLESSHEDLVSF